MTAYEIKRPDGLERGIRVTCPEHGEEQEFQPGYQQVTFYCSGCGIEIDVQLHETDDWRDLGEWC